MVRLKAQIDKIAVTIISNFNSTMVRLKVGIRLKLNSGKISFQFHYGTIKSKTCLISVAWNCISIPLWYD